LPPVDSLPENGRVFSVLVGFIVLHDASSSVLLSGFFTLPAQRSPGRPGGPALPMRTPEWINGLTNSPKKKTRAIRDLKLPLLRENLLHFCRSSTWITERIPR
jgi:hypothetical protein